MIRLIVLLCSIMGLSVLAHAQMTIELDLDGLPGNGPDTLAAAFGDTVDIGIWYLGDEYFVSHSVDVCGIDTADIVSVIHHTGWFSSAQNLDSSCTRVSGVTIDLGYFMPFKVATIGVKASCAGSEEFVEARIDTAALYDNSFDLIALEGTTPAYLKIECATATESASWSDVKTLFR